VEYVKPPPGKKRRGGEEDKDYLIRRQFDAGKAVVRPSGRVGVWRLCGKKGKFARLPIRKGELPWLRKGKKRTGSARPTEKRKKGSAARGEVGKKMTEYVKGGK